jgi:hypothetical protein
MALFWLCYRKADRVAGIAIIEASSMIHARMRAPRNGEPRGGISLVLGFAAKNPGWLRLPLIPFRRGPEPYRNL